MKNNLSKILSFVFLFFVFGIITVNAEEVVNTDSFENRTYVIGTYEFLPDTALTTERIMWSAKSIEGENLTIKNMVIYYKDVEGTWTNAVTGEEAKAEAIPVKENITHVFKPKDETEYIAKLDGLNIKEIDKQKLDLNSTLQLEVEFTPENTYYDSVKWESSNKEVATVDENGKVTAHRTGEVTITVKSEYNNDKTGKLELEVVATEDQIEEAQEDLLTEISNKVSQVNGGKNFEISLDGKKIVVAIINKEESITALAETNALTLLTELNQIRGYSIGEDISYDFYDEEEGNRLENNAIKAQILLHGYSALNVDGNSKLGDLLDENLEVTVNADNGSLDFNDNYTFKFEFIGTNYFDNIWENFAESINQSPKGLEDELKVEFKDENITVTFSEEVLNKNVAYIVEGTQLYESIMDVLKSNKVDYLIADGKKINTLDDEGNKKSHEALRASAMTIALTWFTNNVETNDIEEIIISDVFDDLKVDFELFGKYQDVEISKLYKIKFVAEKEETE